MTIVAMCPYCRAGGVRAPASAVGQSATCPSCKSNFTVVPSDDPAAKAAAVPAAPPPPPLWKVEAAPPKATPARPVVDETREHGSPVDVTEPSPVLPAEQAEPAARPPVPSFTLPENPLDAGATLALVAVILFGVGMGLAQLVPFGRAIGAGLCGLGLVGGVLSLGAEGRGRLIAAAAALLNLVAVLLLLLAPTWLALDPWRADEPDAPPAGPRAVAFRPDGAAELPGGWIDSRAGGWAGGDFRVSVRSAYAGPLDVTGADGKKRATKDRYLRVHLRVRNAGHDRRLDLSGWAAGDDPAGPRLTDPAGKVYKPKAVEAGAAVAGFTRVPSLTPGNAADVLLLFEAPPAGKRAPIEHLRLELPGGPVGSPDPVRFQLPGPF